MKGKYMTKYARERMLLKNTPRRVLNLEERVAAIRMYDQMPVYQQVAVTFKCSWEQIKNIILKRDSILKYYANCQVVQENDGERVERQRKINFLGNVMYEFIKRAYFHGGLQLNDDIIRERALEFRNIIGIDSFYPNKTWIRDFKKVYNVNLNQLDKIVIVKAPLKSLDSKSIVSHCRREVERILQSTQRPKTTKNKKGKNKRVIANNKSNDDYVNDNDDEDVIEIRSESKDSHDNDSRNNVMYVEDGNNVVDDDVDDVMIGNEPSQDLYYGDGDEVINENEDGLTINYGDYEYNEEDDSLMPLFSIKAEKEQLINNSILTANKKRVEDGPEITTRKRVHSDDQVDELLLFPEIALKVEEQGQEELGNDRALTSKRFRSDSENSSKQQQQQDFRKTSADSKANNRKVESAPTSKNTRSSSRNEEKNSNSKKADRETETSSSSVTRIMNYSDALNWMRPLQHFAIAEEDFSALNLLLQLSDVYERARSRKNNG